jgi:soluble lytic murein transglycosylase-like protein
VSPSYKQVKHHLREASNRHGIDYELLQALIATESGFDARAVSPKGAVGLMQIIPATAERYGVSGDARTPVQQKLTDPRTNIRAGSRYLRDLINMFPASWSWPWPPTTRARARCSARATAFPTTGKHRTTCAR